MATKRITAWIDEDVWSQVRVKALTDGMTASDLVEVALMQFIQYKALERQAAKTARAISPAPVREPTRPNPTVDDFGTPVDKAYSQFRPVPKTGKPK